jgi:TIR domain
MEETIYAHDKLIFISHSGKDKRFVKDLCRTIRQKTHNPWTHDTRIKPGHPDWQNKILQAIRQANSFILVLSNDSLKSKWCQWEIEQAELYKKRVFIINYEKLNISSLPKPSELEQDAWGWLFQTNLFEYDDQDEEKTFKEILGAVEKDFEYAEKHAELTGKVHEWIKNNQGQDFLLRGDPLWDAFVWLTSETNFRYTEEGAESALPSYKWMKNGQIEDFLLRRRFSQAAFRRFKYEPETGTELGDETESGRKEHPAPTSAMIEFIFLGIEEFTNVIERGAREEAERIKDRARQDAEKIKAVAEADAEKIRKGAQKTWDGAEKRAKRMVFAGSGVLVTTLLSSGFSAQRIINNADRVADQKLQETEKQTDQQIGQAQKRSNDMVLRADQKVKEATAKLKALETQVATLKDEIATLKEEWRTQASEALAQNIRQRREGQAQVTDPSYMHEIEWLK